MKQTTITKSTWSGLQIAGTVLLVSVCSVFAADQNTLVGNLRTGKRQTVITYGTSLTAGGAWVGQLQGALDRKFPGLAKVVNSGAGAMWSKWGVDNLEERVIAKKPDAVFIEFAVNDAFLEYKTSLEEARKNLQNMIERILQANPQCQVILMTMNPPIGIHLERRPKVDDYYELYRQVAKERNLLLIDHNPNWKRLLQEDAATFNKYVPDGIHPDALGCETVILPQFLESLGIGAPARATLAPAIVLTSPMDYQVFQREDRTKGTVTIAGTLPTGAKGRFRWRGRSITGAVPEEWIELPLIAATHAFSIKVTLPAGGWYRLEVQAYSGDRVLAETQVGHVGMGEVFVVSGQSNSSNYGAEKLVPESGLVASFDGRTWGLANDPQGGCDGSTGGSFIPAFGDTLAKKYQVPIGVASTGQGATSVRQWLPQGVRVKQQPTTGGMKQVGPGEWESNGGLFDRLMQRCALLGPRGFRAVLWHQGESDAGQARAGYPADRQITGEQYFEFMSLLIRASQQKAGWPVPWFTAQATYHSVGDPSDAEFRAAMKKLWDEGVSQEGPDTDALREEYRSGVHFNGKGQREHGRLWAEKVGKYLDSELAKPTPPALAPAERIKFEPTIESLKQYSVPEWFEDAKLGIWAHWGPQGSTEVPYPIDNGWYARFMYEPGSPVYKWHVEHFGHPSVFGYKDIIKRWNPSAFNAAQADKLVKLYKKAGAKFFVAMGAHHDNFDMWDSQYQPRWNAKATTGKDIVGIWHEAAISNGLRFGVSSHVARSYRWFQPSHGADAGGKYDGQDPAYADLYGTPWKESGTDYESMRDRGPAAWETQFENRMKDLLDKYHPDLYYTDGGIPFQKAGLNILSHFYNQSQVWNGSLQAVAPIKLDYTENIAVMDYEFGSSAQMAKHPFMSDKTVNAHWFWLKGDAPHYRQANEVIDYLVDLVSKKGVLLLNIPQRPDGTLEAESEKLLAGMGQCLDVIGEAVFNTRAWTVSGEGPTTLTDLAAGTAKDVRFTRNKANTVLYATVLDWPGDGATLTIQNLNSNKFDAAEIQSITMLGSPGKIPWKQDAAGLRVEMPSSAPDSLYAFALKIAVKSSLSGAAIRPPVDLINDGDPAVTYSGSGWYQQSGRTGGEYGSDIHETASNGDSFSFAFTGTGVEFLTITAANRGDVDIYLDDVLQQTVSCQAGSDHYQQAVYRKTGLARGKHTLKGVKKSGTYLTVDAFKVIQ